MAVAAPKAAANQTKKVGAQQGRRKEIVDRAPTQDSLSAQPDAYVGLRVAKFFSTKCFFL